MNDLFGGDYSGEPFRLFGLPHVVALVAIALINLGLITYGQRIPARWRKCIRFGLAALLLIDEALWHIWNWRIGEWTIQTMLPLHLCSVFVFLSAIMLLTRSYSIFELAYFLGIAGAMQALLTPDAGPYGFPHFRFFQVMVSHGSIVTAAVYMAAVEGYRPTLASIKRVLITGNLYAVAVGIINAVIGSNYLYVARKPETASLLDVLPAWPWYLPILEGIALLMIALLYAPYALRDLRPKRIARAGATRALDAP
ncbi:MAG: TIGR02206 family membrane protein [Anaerolineae bacterium]